MELPNMLLKRKEILICPPFFPLRAAYTAVTMAGAPAAVSGQTPLSAAAAAHGGAGEGCR